jgi:hypothetical protein
MSLAQPDLQKLYIKPEQGEISQKTNQQGSLSAALCPSESVVKLSFVTGSARSLRNSSQWVARGRSAIPPTGLGVLNSQIVLLFYQA